MTRPVAPARPAPPSGTPASLVDRVRHRLASSGGAVSAAGVAAAVRAEAGGVISDREVLAALRLLQRELTGSGPLEELLRDPATTDVLVNGPGSVWVDRGTGLVRAGVKFTDDDAVRRLAQRLALLAGRRLDDASPFVDALLPGGVVRLHAVLPPVSAGGTCLSLRVLRPAAHDLAALRRLEMIDDDGWRLLTAIVRARLAFLIAGGTASGKTTLLSALLATVPPDERVVCVEDAEELRPAHPHVVRLVARPPNIEGAGEVLLRDLVRQALRMRPDRLVVGEVRGAEVCDLLAAMNTGHEGGAGTVHANSAEEVPARLEALAALGGMARAALHSQLGAAIQVVLQVARDGRGRRRLVEAALLHRPAGAAPGGGEVTVRPVWRLGAGWLAGRTLLDDMLRRRGVAPPC